MAAVAAQYNFWFRVCCFCWLQKAKMYQQAKSSTHHNSRLRYNYFRFGKNKRPPYWNSTCGFIFDHFIVIAVLFSVRLLNFVQIGPPTAIIWRHINFATCRPLLPVSYLLMSLPSKNQGSLPANQISSTYLNSRLRYNYFRFWQTNVRHIGILLPVSISRLFHRNWRVILHRAAEFRKNRNIHCGNMTSYRFSRWRPSAMLYMLWG